MSTTLKIRIVDDSAFASDTLREMIVSGVEIKSRTPIERGLPIPFEMVIALRSVGGFTTIYQVICRLLEKDKNRELIISRGDVKISIKGHSLQEERELLEKLAPEFIDIGFRLSEEHHESFRNTDLSNLLNRGTNMISILFLSADPTDASRLRLGEELREIQEKLQLAKLRERFELQQRMSVRPVDISQALLDVQPKIVHFSGHGAATGALCFENQVGETHPIQPAALAALFEQFANQVNCVILNACYSEIQANAIAKHIDYVIGMNHVIGDKAAIVFAIGFYQALGAGRTIEEAYKLGCVQIRLQNIPEHLTPVLIKKE